MSHRRSLFPLFVSVLFCVCALLVDGCDEGQIEADNTAALAGTSLPVQAVSQQMRYLENYGLSGALLIAEKGRVVLDEVYGFADRRLGRPVSHDTLFDIASVSKQFTAAAVLKLQEEGRLRTTDRLGEHLSAVPDDKFGITLHQLLTHTSGLADPQSHLSIPADRDEAIASLLEIPLSHPPGSAYSYSNAGYSLLAAVIERVSETSFEDYIRSQLFSSAGLRETHFVWEAGPELDALIAVGEGAYEGSFQSGDPRTRPNAWLLRGSGNMLSSTRELWRWEQALTEGSVLSKDSLSTLFHPHTIAEADFLHYGYGWRLQRTPRHSHLIWHSGWEDAFSAVLRSYVDEEVVVIFTSNVSVDLVPLREIVLRSAREGVLGEILFEGESVEVPRTIDSSPESMRLFAGQYELDRGGVLQVTLEKDDLIVSPAGQEAVEALWSKSKIDRTMLAGKSLEALELAGWVHAGEVHTNDARFKTLDPFGFAGVTVSELRAEWRKLEAYWGALDHFEAVGTAPIGLEGREVPVTLLRLHFEAGSKDYRLIWYADDEIYLLSGAPKSFRKILRRIEGSRFLHYDLLSERSFVVAFEEREGVMVGLRLLVDGATNYARRADRE